MTDEPQEILDERLMKLSRTAAEQIAAELNSPASIDDIEQMTLIIYGTLVEAGAPLGA